MNNVSAAAHDGAQQLAHLLFRIFIYVTDTEKEITSYEVQRFNRMIDDPRWTSSPPLRRALMHLRSDYTDLWGAYETAKLDVGFETIQRGLEAAWFAQSGDVAELRGSLVEFVRKLGQTASPLLARLGIVGAAISRTNAFERVRNLIDRSELPVRPVTDLSPSAAESPWLASPLIDGSSVWMGGRIKARCVNVTDETHDVRTFWFSAVPARLFRYLPGQFVTLELPIGGRTVRRTYTLSSSPSRPWMLSVTVKRVPGGVASGWLHDNMREGMEINISGPGGQFTCVNHANPRLLMLSGGSGVTPMMSMLRWICDTNAPADVVFINNVRSPADVIFERELELISTRMNSRLRLAIVPGTVGPGQRWNGLTGPLSDHVVQTFAPDFAEREVFVCGPTGYMDMARNMLTALGHPMNHHHQESFGGTAAPAGSPPVRTAPAAAVSAPVVTTPAPAPAPWRSAAPAVPLSPVEVARSLPPARPMAAPAPVPPQRRSVPSVKLSLQGATVACEPDETILDAAQRCGINLPSSCRSGTCGTCRTRMVSGAVEMQDQRALGPQDIAEGWILPCVSLPTGPVELEA